MDFLRGRARGTQHKSFQLRLRESLSTRNSTKTWARDSPTPVMWAAEPALWIMALVAKSDEISWFPKTDMLEEEIQVGLGSPWVCHGMCALACLLVPPPPHTHYILLKRHFVRSVTFQVSVTSPVRHSLLSSPIPSPPRTIAFHSWLQLSCQMHHASALCTCCETLDSESVSLIERECQLSPVGKVSCFAREKQIFVTKEECWDKLLEGSKLLWLKETSW